VVLTSNDVIRHDGSSSQSILDKTTRRWLFKTIDSESYDKCFLTKNVYFNEVWICFPELGQARCTKALVYNYKDSTVSFRDLPQVTSGATGLVDEGAAETFDSSVGTNDSDDAPFNAGSEFGAQLTRTMLCAPDRPALVLADSTPKYFGANIPGFIERVGISLDAPNQVKTAYRMRPRVTAPAGTMLKFRIGSHMSLNDTVTWSDQIDFTVGEDVSVDAFAAGRFLAWRLDSDTSSSWRLDGLDIEYNPNGGW
jgi:hypothetical protein